MSRQSANEFLTVEVVNTVERRRWPLAEKLRIVEESCRPGMSVSYVARKYGVALSWGGLMEPGMGGLMEPVVSFPAGSDFLSLFDGYPTLSQAVSASLGER